MKRKVIFTIIGIIMFSYILPCWAEQTWDFKRTYESKAILNSPFFLFTATELSNNGMKELIVTDFGEYGDHVEEWLQWKKNHSLYTIKILEWEHSELITKFIKQWDITNKSRDDAEKYFMANHAKQIVSLQLDSHVTVETVPPFLSIEWKNGKYLLREQQGWAQDTPLVGSWVFPWVSPSCYQNFPKNGIPIWPRECLYYIRDFSGNGSPKIVTILEEEIIKDKKYNQTIRVRKFAPNFPIEWETASPRQFRLMNPYDKFNYKASGPVLLGVRKMYSFEQDKQHKDYLLKDIHLEDTMDFYIYDLPDVYLRKSQKKEKEEYWGYKRVDLSDEKHENFMNILRRVTFKQDMSGFAIEDIKLPHHDHFLGVGHFDLQDIDGDGLDEVILVEETGKQTLGNEWTAYDDIKDYIHILKWDGAKYRDMWISPPYTKRGTKFLVDDIKGTGKKQLVVLTPYGTVQIWEKR